MIFSKKIKKIVSSIITFTFILTLFPYYNVRAAVNDAPGIPSISHNQWGTDVDGNYDITASMWFGNTATSYKLYEKFGIAEAYKVVAEGKLEVSTTPGQQVVIPIRGSSKTGMYSYYVEFINQYGSSQSMSVQVQVGYDGNTRVLIDGVDNDSVKSQFTIAQGVKEYKLTNSQALLLNSKLFQTICQLLRLQL